ncbi:MAG: hypothetical protein ACYC26_11350, partial [Phycisphaerales bacterium]
MCDVTLFLSPHRGELEGGVFEHVMSPVNVNTPASSGFSLPTSPGGGGVRNRAFSYVATCQPCVGWGAGIVSGSGQSAIGARNLDGHAAHEIVYEADAAYSRSG